MMLNWQTVAFAKNQFFHPNCLVDIGWPMQAVQRWENLGVIWSIPFPKWCPLLHCLQFNPPNVASKIICIFIPSPIPCSAIFKQYILSLSLYIYILQQIINPYKFPPLTNPSTNCQKKICQKKDIPSSFFQPTSTTFFRFIFARVQKAMPSSSSSTMVKPFSNLKTSEINTMVKPFSNLKTSEINHGADMMTYSET